VLFYKDEDGKPLYRIVNKKGQFVGDGDFSMISLQVLVQLLVLN